MKNSVLISRVSAAVVLVLSGPLAFAENMTFSGTLINPPPCIISGGNTIDVPFGENLGVNKINGINYTQNVPYTVTCDTPAGGSELGLTIISGSVTTFDPAAIQTDTPDLGIRILKNGTAFTLNTRVPYDKNNPPVLQAVPVQAPGATLTEGAFAATATLLVDYQ
ncbi:fimbrial protein [Yersinia bercovieri]|uniref:fimbrial protein n=1 Tax=Yersinia bercovieri TaxID=634 RepID=UPI0005E78370|nr:fimbrial protein [Yersinia bercovieri]MCB5303342.1 fimbrial protein [Yersinia bercovieri]MDN0104793.1 fimbrial protein [Yersinia bercovieri]CNH97419.1 minor pili exported protein [Yersinia bercovieri]